MYPYSTSSVNSFVRYPLSLGSTMVPSKPTSLPSLHQSSPSTPSHYSTTTESSGTHYDRQYSYAQRSRQAASPHHHARTAALLARTATPANPITMTNPASIRPIPQKGAEDEEHTYPWSTLDMGGMGLHNLSKVLTQHYLFLTVLYINHNNLTVLPSSLSKLVNLTILDASANQLSNIPPELGLLVQLKELLLFDNQLTTLPTELGTLYQLETFGLDGNPIDSDTTQLLLEEGAPAVIANLRENAEVGMPPPQREMIRVLDTDDDDGKEPVETLSVLCYNVLCQKFANTQAYGYTPSWALGWDYRKELLMTEILRWNTDVVCLQEVEMSQFEDFFRDRFEEAGGYEGIFFPKSRAKIVPDEERRTVDGCAIFYKAARFKLVAHHLLEYSQNALQRADFKESEDTFNRVMTKDNVAVMILLQDIKTGSRAIVANSHIHSNPAFTDVKLVQVGLLLEEIEEFTSKQAAANIPTVICGDFNSTPDSGVYEFLTKGSIKQGHSDFGQHVYGHYTTKGLSHNLASLKSAYATIGELPFTNYTPRFKGVLDYIWYTADTLDTASVLGPIDQDYLDKVVGFPNPHFPSDHIAIAAQLRFKKARSNTRSHPHPHSHTNSIQHSDHNNKQ